MKRYLHVSLVKMLGMLFILDVDFRPWQNWSM